MKVAVFMGSTSDSAVMKKATDTLTEFGVEHKVFVISAHRALHLLEEEVSKLEEEGFEVVIAGAGLAAALPGVIAGLTTLPVIGVPLECIGKVSKEGENLYFNGLHGVDALLSIVQMPPSIPVATVGINNTKNAAILAVEILSVKYPVLKEKLKEMKNKLYEAAKESARKGINL